LDGQTLKFRSNRGQALLIYLVTERLLGAESHRRKSLMALLWPGMPQKSAQINLRQTLYQLRQALPPVALSPEDESVSLLHADRTTVALATHYPIKSDVGQFASLLKGPEDRWPEALDLYRGDFLADFFLPDANSFEEWAAARRAAFRRQALDTLGRLAQSALERNDASEAERYARRQLGFDNLRESAHRQLMEALAIAGERSSALAHYGEMEQLLEGELGAEPSAESHALYQRLLSGETMPVSPPMAIVGERAPRKVGPSPYRGLAAFRESDAPFFFGRESLVGQLTKAVRRRALVHVLLGSSGSGKSSVVYAGLLPRLRADGNWLIASARPGSQPFQAAAAALVTLLEPDLSEADRLIETQKLGRALAQGDVSLESVARRTVEKAPGTARLLFLIDQFEELYTLCADDGLRRRFLDELLATVASSAQSRTPPLVFLLTLRADFMGQALSHRPFADALQDASFMIGPMTPEELQQAIQRPAEKQGAAFEEGLVERLLKDVGQEPGHLPLLEFALTLLWEKQDDGWLAHAHYNEIGQVEGALARYADDVLGELEEGERELARQIFVQLVRPGQGTEDTRRVAARSELGDDRWSLVRHLADQRLVVTGRDESSDQETVEVVHEALIQRWGQLKAWMTEDRGFRTWQERLRSGLGGWLASGSDEGALLRGGPLAEAEEWLAQRKEQLSDAEREFIRASISLRERRAKEREAQRQRELATAQELAETQSRRAEEQSLAAAGMRRRALLLAGAGSVAVILAVLAYFNGQRAVEERAEAETQADLAFSRELAGASLETRELDPQLSVLLALEAVSTAETREAENALHQSLHALHIPRDLPGDIGVVFDLALSHDGKLLAAAGEQGVLVWDAHTLEGKLFIETDEVVSSISFVPDSSLLALGTELGKVELWDIGTPQRLKLLETTSSSSILSLSLSADGTILAAGYRRPSRPLSQYARIWHVESGELLRPFPEIIIESAYHDGSYTPRYKLALSPSGKTLATGAFDGRLRLWDVSTGEKLQDRLGPEHGLIDAIAFSPDGARLAVASHNGNVWLFRYAEDSQDLLLSASISERAFSLAFSHDGSKLATVGDGGVAKVWDAETGEPITTMTGPKGLGYDVVFSLDGAHLFTAGTSEVVTVWDAAPGRELLTLSGTAIRDFDLSSDGARLATASDSVTIWDLESGLKVLTPPLIDPWQLKFSPSGDRVVVAHAPENGSSLSVWDTGSGQELVRIPSIWNSVYGVDFSPNGSQIATSKPNPQRPLGCLLQLWNAETGRIVHNEDRGRTCDNGLEYSHASGLLLTAAGEGEISAWDPATGEVLETASESKGSVGSGAVSESGFLVSYLGQESNLTTSFTVSPDGKQLALGRLSGEILVWNVESGYAASLLTLIGHAGQVWSIDFSPDGKRLASASFDNTVRVWDLSESPATDTATTAETSFRELLKFTAHTDYATGVAFTPDGDQLVSSSRDGTVRVYTLVLEELVDLARDRVTRALTTEECQRYLHMASCPERGG
jgi:WD40 repeat protein/DNA-binding SARP family transcriptional activator